ncbi:hypothetical protein [Bradyrhizobium sp. B120]|uniref:hypothetical protein n=1 Tax=Bradyrhizobium sp. B120 TaxID=3410088 RepID=UPI003B987820
MRVLYLERGSIGASVENERFELDARRDVVRRVLKQKLASLRGHRAAVSEL